MRASRLWPAGGPRRGARIEARLAFGHARRPSPIMLNGSQCSAVERIPGKVSGVWLFKGTRVPVQALFENLESGATVENFLEWFPGVAREQSRRWSHVLTPDRRRNRRGVCKSWPQGGPSRGGQAALVKESPALMCRPLLPQERSRHGAASNIETPKVDRPRCGHKSQRFSNGSRWATFLPLKNQRPDPVRHST